MTAYHPWNADLASDLIKAHAGREGPLLPILHDVQATFGHVPEPVVPMIAEALNVSRAEVHGVVTFYHDFRAEPAGRHVLKLCQAEACQSRGSDALAAQAEKRLGVKLGNTTPNGNMTLEPIYCLGLCSTAPSAMLDGRIVGRLDAKKLDALLTEAAR